MLGRIVRWHADRGFGWIETPTGRELFCHISAFGEPKPADILAGQRVSYEIGPDDFHKNGKDQAVSVEFV